MAIIGYDISDGIARIRLDNPAGRNALSLDDWHALSATVDEAATSEAKVLIVESTDPGIFCAGSDLRELAALASDVEARSSFREGMRRGLDRLRDLPIPTIAAIDGPCMGAGVALALACDIRFAGKRACFAVTPARLGISYPQEDVARLARAVGRGQAARLLFGAVTIDAREAERIGLVELLVVSAASEAETFARAVAGNASSSVRALKSMLFEERSQCEAYDRSFDSFFADQAFLEGLAAFSERRKPRFI